MGGSDITTRIRGDVLSAFALLSRLPLPNHAPRGADSAWAWPLVGGVLGAIAAGGATVLLAFGVTPGVAAALTLGLMAALTGALHEDGLADTADGLFGGWTVERRLEIMKDSRIGTFGAVALMFATLAKWSALTALMESGPVWAALIAVGALSRVPMAVMMAALPNARDRGLSRSMGQPSAGTAALAAALGLVLALIAVGSAAPTILLVSALAALALGLAARARIGGQTGDILGASQQLAEIAAFGVLAAAVS